MAAASWDGILQQGLAGGGPGPAGHKAALVRLGLDVHFEVGHRQHVGGSFRPFGQLQASAGKQVAKARFLPFARIVEAVEVEMPDGQTIGLMRFDDGIGRGS
jgi:hypothetical protein